MCVGMHTHMLPQFFFCPENRLMLLTGHCECGGRPTSVSLVWARCYDTFGSDLAQSSFATTRVFQLCSDSKEIVVHSGV